eukprot:217117-Rhodomonas_salina.1
MSDTDVGHPLSWAVAMQCPAWLWLGCCVLDAGALSGTEGPRVRGREQGKKRSRRSRNAKGGQAARGRQRGGCLLYTSDAADDM